MTFIFVFIKFVDFNIWGNIADKRNIYLLNKVKCPTYCFSIALSVIIYQ